MLPMVTEYAVVRVAIYILACITLYVIGIMIYRLFFHPHACYPGPFLAKVTDWYSVYHAWKGNRFLDFHRCHDKYGPVFRYGPNRLSFNTHTALHSIYSPKANVRKADFYNMLTTRAGPNIVSAIPKDLHARMKRNVAPAFSDKALRSMEEYFLTHIRTLCIALASVPGPVNAAEWFTYLSGDILGDFAFGKPLGLLKGQSRGMIDGMIASGRYSLICGCAVKLHKTLFPQLFFRDLLARRASFRTFALSQASRRTDKIVQPDRRDLFFYLTEAKNPLTDEIYTLPELLGDAASLIIAGTDTTSMALTATIFYLTHNADALARAKEEVRTVFGEMDIETVCSGTLLNSCKYLRACIDEAMRMSPPVPGGIPRTVLPGGLSVDGHSIPAGSEVAVSLYSLHHNPCYFRDPFTYRPERFLGDPKEEGMQAFMPFSTGPRVCIGKSMAYMEMMVTMARLLLLFEMRAVGSLGEGEVGRGMGRERRGEYQVVDALICEQDGPMVEFKPVVLN